MPGNHKKERLSESPHLGQQPQTSCSRNCSSAPIADTPCILCWSTKSWSSCSSLCRLCCDKSSGSTCLWMADGGMYVGVLRSGYLEQTKDEIKWPRPVGEKHFFTNRMCGSLGMYYFLYHIRWNYVYSRNNLSMHLIHPSTQHDARFSSHTSCFGLVIVLNPLRCSINNRSPLTIHGTRNGSFDEMSMFIFGNANQRWANRWHVVNSHFFIQIHRTAAMLGRRRRRA